MPIRDRPIANYISRSETARAMPIGFHQANPDLLRAGECPGTRYAGDRDLDALRIGERIALVGHSIQGLDVGRGADERCDAPVNVPFSKKYWSAAAPSCRMSFNTALSCDLLEGGNGHRGRQADDDHDNHNLYKGEALLKRIVLFMRGYSRRIEQQLRFRPPKGENMDSRAKAFAQTTSWKSENIHKKPLNPAADLKLRRQQIYTTHGKNPLTSPPASSAANHPWQNCMMFPANSFPAGRDGRREGMNMVPGGLNTNENG